MAKVVLYGTGDVAQLLHYFLTHDSNHDVVAFCLDAERMTTERLSGLPVVPFEEVERHYPPDGFALMVAIGFQRVNRARAQRFDRAKALGYTLPSYISSSSVTWPDLEIGENCIVMERNLIQPFVVIGDDVILGPGNSIGHHVQLMDHVFLASEVDLSGRVRVEPYSFLGANATVRDGVTVAEGTVVGANAVVVRDTQPRGVYVAPRAQRLPLPSDKLPRI